MMTAKKYELAAKVRQVFEVLARHPQGLSGNQLWEQLSSLNPNGNGNGGPKTGNSGGLISFEQLSFACVGPIKAGWLVVAGSRWSLSDEGREAFTTYGDPQQFMIEAGKRSKQGWLAVHFPIAYAAAGKTKDQITAETRTIRRVGVSRLVKETFGKRSNWQEVLPIQSPQTVAITGLPSLSQNSLKHHLLSAGVSFSEGSHATYLPPESFNQTAFRSLAANYPGDAGLKIMKNPGSVDDSTYVVGRAKGDSRIQLGMVHGHRYLSLVANFLHLNDVGPRLYDLVNLRFDDQLWTAYVVQDVQGRCPTVSECQSGIQKLKQLHADGVLKVILPQGFEDDEFQCPTCGNNALVNAKGEFQYIDFQNFLLGDYESFLKKLAMDAAEQTHFGDTAMLRGGRYLYQSIPGVNLPAKRSVTNRMKTLTRLLTEAQVSLTGRLVLDVGCNIGMMMAQYLKLGAKWCHGWDRELTTRHTERMLLALGCTRFSTTGTDISSSQPLGSDVPAHMRSSLDGCAISYLAIRGHLGWLEELKQVPWSFMIYEGHEGETKPDFEHYLSELRTLTNFELGPVDSYLDGDSDPRTVAILLRRP